MTGITVIVGIVVFLSLIGWMGLRFVRKIIGIKASSSSY